MANNNEEQTKSSKPADKPSQLDKIQNKSATKAGPSSKPLARRIPLLSSALALLALLVAFYAIYAAKQSQERNQQQTQTINRTIEEIKQQQSDTQNNLNTVKTTTHQSQTNMQNQMQAMHENLESALQQRLFQTQDWLLLKARYYLELAQINAHWSDDQGATISLLQQADALLRNIPDQQLFNIRQAIAQEIVQLQSLPKIDVAGLLSQLDAAENAIDNLPIKQPLDNSQLNQASNKENPGWRQKFKESIYVLEKLVVVRRNDEDIQPLLSPLHQTLLRDSIRFNLQEAQWALLHNNSKIYQLALSQALKNIKRAFNENALATQTLIKQLQSLQQEKLETVRPTIDQSLILLNQLIASKQTQSMDTSTTEGGKAQ
ncbi:uroporphyrinogen III methylase [Legionella nautarum]|uniref:Uroporphyrinogen III methylase n=1 Tax=Legionella nautarum TaxID=45070 RepID=A0A0W0WLU7_9GAMM|nr:uroporphyrinogen-III C-methyltransferase [Legionella nautarum]KTD33307.1 uroporphyrinogen III methylase [Legionella nautarum]